MGDRSPPQQTQIQLHPQRYYQEGTLKGRGGATGQTHGPSPAKILAVITLVPLGGALLGLAGLTLFGTLAGLAVAFPLFIIFSPVIVPAAITILLAITAFLTSGVFGLTAVSSLSWVYRYARRATGSVPEQLDQAKKRMQEMAGYVGQKTKDVGQEIQSRGQDQGTAGSGRAQDQGLRR